MNGSLQKKNNSKNWYMVYLVTDTNGKSKQKWESTKTSNRNEAKKILRNRLNELDYGINTQNKNLTCFELFEKYRDTSRYNKLAYNTKSRYSSIFKTSLIPFFGMYKIKNITSALIQEYIDKLEIEEKKSTYTIKHHFSLLKSTFEYAKKKMRLISYNPCLNVDVPERKKRKYTIWNAEQCTIFRNYIENKSYYIPLLLLMTTGARIGEICALKINDYNKNTGYITIAHSMSRNMKIKDTKTSNVREFKLPKSTKIELDKYLLSQKEIKLFDINYNKDNFLCINYHFNPYNPNSLGDTFTRIMRKLNLPHIRPHDLRHSFITLMVENMLKNGQNDLKTISEMVGHSSTKKTEEVYLHVTENMKANLSNDIETVFYNSLEVH